MLGATGKLVTPTPYFHPNRAVVTSENRPGGLKRLEML
jgi:hypothetical protein